MKLDLSNLSFSKSDIANNVTVPKILDKELAYFIGIHLGDGTMNKYGKYYYSIGYSGHLVDEYEFYTKYFRNLFRKFFNKELYIRERLRPNRNSLDLSTQSKGIFTFLNTSLDILPGPKIANPIPKIILNSKYNPEFVRGLADSDFSLTFKSKCHSLHKYPTISLNTNNKLLLLDVNTILQRDFNFKTYTLFDFPKKRYNKYYISNQLDINGTNQLENWMKLIGFCSRKHVTKYLIWKKFGFCPPYTTLPQRELILKEELDPYSFYKF